MTFLRKYVVIDMSGTCGKAFFNDYNDAVDHKVYMLRKYPHCTFKIFKEIM